MPHPTEIDDAPDAPCFNALMVGTYALMTRWAATPEGTPAGDAPGAIELRTLLARKIVSNLFFMVHHPATAGPVAGALAQAHAEWATLAAGANTPCAETRPAHLPLH